MDLFIDQYVGYWIKNVPYKLDPLYSLKKKRIYDVSNVNIKLPKINKTCKNLVEFKKKFNNDYKSKNTYVNGRNHYWFQSLPPTISTIELEKTRLKSTMHWKPIFEILCGTIKGELPCTKLGINISSSLINVASTRIFNHPEQCIVEMLVNSVDSYGVIKGIPKVGRFGMGFFSIFYFLINHPLRSLSILTIQDKKAVCLKIRYKNRLFYKINVVETESVNGTFIFLDAGNDLFDSREILFFKKFYNYTRLVESCTIYDYGKKKMITRKKTDFPIVVDCNPSHLFVEDFATGMSLETVLNSLLIPSVSTKTITLSTEKTVYENYSTIEPDTKLTLSIVVNRVCIVMLPIKIESHYSVIISLPSNVTLPVTRDDVIFSGNTQKELIDSLKILLKKSIELGTLLPLEHALDAYLVYTSNTDNKTIIIKFIEKMYETLSKKNYMLIKPVYSKIFSQIFPNMIVSNKMNSLLVEQQLDMSKSFSFSTTIFKNKRVVILDKIENTTSANTYKYIFINKKDTSKANWQKDLLLTFTEQRLYPISSELDSYESNLLEESIKECTYIFKDFLSPEKLDMIRTLCTVMLSIQDRYLLGSFKKIAISTNIFNALYLHKLDQTFLPIFIEAYIKYYSGLNFDYSYGQTKYVFKPSKIYDSMIMLRSHYSKLLEPINKDSHFIENNYNYIKHIKEYVLLEVELYSDNLYELYNSLSFRILSTIGTFKPWCCASHAMTYIKLLEEYLKSDISIYEILLLINVLHYLNKNNTKLCEITDLFLKNKKIVLKRCKYIYEKYIKKIESYKLINQKYWIKKIQLQYAIQNFILFTDNSFELSVESIPTDYPSSVSYTFKQLLHYVFKNEQINLLDPSISRLPKQKTLQILEIAVDSSTSKPFLTSTLTELIQNSMDAIRLSGISQKDVKITIGELAGSNSLFISIKDNVGMTISNLTAVCIPFYSDKVASEFVTGEMGTGFFNIYRESTSVLIDTVRDGKRLQIFDTPIREEDRIIDISKKLVESTVKSDNGTNITFIIPYKESYISEAYYYIQHVLSYMNFDNLYLNDIHVKLEKVKVYEKGSLICYMTLEPNISFLFTKGVPFCPLSEYLDSINLYIPKVIYEILGSYVIIDMGHDFYKPVQSRTKIQQTNENFIIFTEFLYQSIFIVAIRRLYDSIINKENTTLYLNNIDFTGESSQVMYTPEKKMIKWNSLQDVILYTPIVHKNGVTTLSLLFNNFCKLKLTYKEIAGTSEDLSNILDDKYVKSVYLAWVSTKNTKDVSKKEDEHKNVTEKENKDEKDEKDEQDKILFIFKTFVNLFDTEKNVKNVLLKIDKPGTTASYNKTNRSITINLDYINIKDVNYFISNIRSYLKNITNIRDDKFYNDWFALSNPASTVPHELEHSRRNSSHEDKKSKVGSHDSITYKGEMMSFDKVANTILKEKMENSLVQNWLKELKKGLLL